MSGACTGFNYNATTASCFLYAQIKEYAIDPTAPAYTQAVTAGMAADCTPGPLRGAWATVERAAPDWRSVSRRLNKKATPCPVQRPPPHTHTHHAHLDLAPCVIVYVRCVLRPRCVSASSPVGLRACVRACVRVSIGGWVCGRVTHTNRCTRARTHSRTRTIRWRAARDDAVRTWRRSGVAHSLTVTAAVACIGVAHAPCHAHSARRRFE